ncbi:MAG: hypothetical protein JJE55_06820 [Flavobacteriaceae bacterium]|nr:hypothetical protein [Flavobacteriaceae bacterium]
MIQKNIRPYNGQQYTKEEGSEIIEELDNRTKSENTQLNSMTLIGESIANGFDRKSNITQRGEIYISSSFNWASIPASYANSKFIIRYFRNLGGITITLPENVELDFQGGRLSNCTIVGNKTIINETSQQILDKDVIFSGDFSNYKVNVEWFGVEKSKSDASTKQRNSEILNHIVNSISNIRVIKFDKGSYYFSEKVLMDGKQYVLSGEGKLSTKLYFHPVDAVINNVFLEYKYTANPGSYLSYNTIKGLFIGGNNLDTTLVDFSNQVSGIVDDCYFRDSKIAFKLGFSYGCKFTNTYFNSSTENGTCLVMNPLPVISTTTITTIDNCRFESSGTNQIGIKLHRTTVNIKNSLFQSLSGGSILEESFGSLNASAVFVGNTHFEDCKYIYKTDKIFLAGAAKSRFSIVDSELLTGGLSGTTSIYGGYTDIYYRNNNNGYSEIFESILNVERKEVTQEWIFSSQNVSTQTYNLLKNPLANTIGSFSPSPDASAINVFNSIGRKITKVSGLSITDYVPNLSNFTCYEINEGGPTTKKIKRPINDVVGSEIEFIFKSDYRGASVVNFSSDYLIGNDRNEVVFYPRSLVKYTFRKSTDILAFKIASGESGVYSNISSLGTIVGQTSGAIADFIIGQNTAAYGTYRSGTFVTGEVVIANGKTFTLEGLPVAAYVGSRTDLNGRSSSYEVDYVAECFVSPQCSKTMYIVGRDTVAYSFLDEPIYKSYTVNIVNNHPSLPLDIRRFDKTTSIKQILAKETITLRWDHKLSSWSYTINSANMPIQANSAATTVSEIVTDFNALLTKLRTAKLLNS